MRLRLGIFGGAGLGLVEVAIMMGQVARSAGAMSAASAAHINIFSTHPIVVAGSAEQKARWLPDLPTGRVKPCFGVTEPNAGLDTTAIETRAEKAGGGYVIHGRKIWTATAGDADKIMLLARYVAHRERQENRGLEPL
jgi:acyl-CoA dehydrogenase